MLTKAAAPYEELAEISEIRSVSELRESIERELERELAPVPAPITGPEPSYSLIDPLEGDALSSSARRRSEHPCAFDAIAFLEGPRVLTITWLPPAPGAI